MEGIMPAECATDDEGNAWLKEQNFENQNSTNVALHDGFSPIHVACQQGNMRVVQWLASNGVSLQTKTKTDLAFTPLIISARFGHLELVRWIYNAIMPRVSLHDERDARGTTIVMYAAEKGHLDVIKFLLECHGNNSLLHDTNNKGSTVLIWSTHDQSMRVMKWLYAQGCALQTTNNEGNAAVMFATINGNLTMLQWLHDNGCRLDGYNVMHESLPTLAADSGHLHVLQYLARALQGNTAPFESRDREGKCMLHFAAMGGRQSAVEWIYQNYPQLLDCADNDGFSALLLAAKHNKPDTVRYLVGKGASLTLKSRRTGITLGMLAAVNCPVELCVWLHEVGANFKSATVAGTNAGCFAAQYGRLETVKWLVSLFPGLTQYRGETDEDMAMYAARHGRVAIVQFLLGPDLPPTAKPISVTRKNAEGDSIASIAALEGRLEVLQWIAGERFPNLLKLQPTIACSCLMNACARGFLEVAEWLVTQKQVDVNISSPNGTSPCMWASQMGHIPILEFLYSQGAKLCYNRQRVSPVLFAAIGGRVKTLKWLAERGAPISGTDNHGASALFWAAQSGSKETVMWLLNHGADPLESTPEGNDLAEVAKYEGHTELAAWIQQVLK